MIDNAYLFSEGVNLAARPQLMAEWGGGLELQYSKQSQASERGSQADCGEQ